MSVSDEEVLQHSVDDWEPSGEVVGESISDIVRLPGMWEADQECLSLRPIGFCEAGHVQLGSESDCSARTCPVHWGSYRRRAAEKVVARMAAYRYGQQGVGRRVLHVVASPPQDRRWTLNRFWSMRGESYELIEEHGGRGGASIPHAYVPNEEGKALYASAVDEGYWEEEKGIWRLLRESSEDWEALREVIEVRPHVHQMVPWEDLDGDELREELPEDWVVHNVRSLEPFFLYESEVWPGLQVGEDGRIERSAEDVIRDGFEDMARLTMYLLSHAAVQPEVGEEISRRNTVTYWGDVHPNAFDPEEQLEAEEWEKIQRYAAEAVGREPEIEEDGDGVEVEECRVEDCKAVVHGLEELGDFLSDVREYEGWFEGLDREQQWEIWGLWSFMRDRPPPGGPVPDLDGDGENHDLPPGGFGGRSPEVPEEIVMDRESVIEWLRRLGRQRLDQSPVYGMAVAGD